MELEFHSMKRKRLQALCKKHGIPANLTNLEMANRLSLLLKETEIPDVSEPSSSMNLVVEVKNEIGSASAVVPQKTKKVRFNSVNETFIFLQSEAEVTTIRKRPSRRKEISASKKQVGGREISKRLRSSSSEVISISSDSDSSAQKKPVGKRRVSKKFNSSTSVDTDNVDVIERTPPVVKTTQWNLRSRGFVVEKGNGVEDDGNLEASKQNVSLKQQGGINGSSTMQNGDEESGRIEVVTGQAIKVVPEITDGKKSIERTSNLARKEDVKVLVEPQDKGVVQRTSRRKSVGDMINDSISAGSNTGVIQRTSRRRSVWAKYPQEPVMMENELQSQMSLRRSSRLAAKRQSLVLSNSVSVTQSKKQKSSGLRSLAKDVSLKFDAVRDSETELFPEQRMCSTVEELFCIDRMDKSDDNEDTVAVQVNISGSPVTATNGTENEGGELVKNTVSDCATNAGTSLSQVEASLHGNAESETFAMEDSPDHSTPMFSVEQVPDADTVKESPMAELEVEEGTDETDEAGLKLSADSAVANNAMDKGILYDSNLLFASKTSEIQNDVVLDEENGMPTAARIAHAGTVTDGGGCIMFPLEGLKSDDTCSPQLLESLEGRDDGELVMNTVSDDADHLCTRSEENTEGESFPRDDSPDPSIHSWLMDERPPEANTMMETAAAEVDVEDCAGSKYCDQCDEEAEKMGCEATIVDEDLQQTTLPLKSCFNETSHESVFATPGAFYKQESNMETETETNDLNLEQHDFVDQKQDTELYPTPGLPSHTKIEEISSSADNTYESHGTISAVMTISGKESDCLLQISARTQGSEPLGVEREENAVFQECHSQDSIDCSCEEEIVETIFSEMKPNAAEAYAVEKNDEYQEISPDSCAVDNVMDEGPHKGSHVQFTFTELQPIEDDEAFHIIYASRELNTERSNILADTVGGDDMDESRATRLEVTTSLVKGSDCSLQIHEMIPESEPMGVEKGETGPVLECCGQDSADGCRDDIDEAGIKLSVESEGANNAMDKGILDNSHIALASETSEIQNDVLLDEENGMTTAARIARAGTVTDGGGCIMFPLEGSKSEDTCSPQLLESLEGRDDGEQVMNTLSDDANHVCTRSEENTEGESFARDNSPDPIIPSWLTNTMKEIRAAEVDVEDCAGSKYCDQCDEEAEKMSNDDKYCGTNPRGENSSFQLELFKAGSVKTNNHTDVDADGDRCRAEQSYSVNEAVSMMIDSVTNGEQSNDLNLEQHGFVDQKKDTELCPSPGLSNHANIEEISSSVDNTYESHGIISEVMTSSGKESDCLLQISARAPGSEPLGVEREEIAVFQECHCQDSIGCSCQEETVGTIYNEMTPNAPEAYAGEAIDGKTHADSKLDDGEDRVEKNDEYQEISPDSCAAGTIMDEGPHNGSPVQFKANIIADTIGGDDMDESRAPRLEVTTSLVKASESSLQIHEIAEGEPMGVEKGESGTVQECCGQVSAYLVSNAAEIRASEAPNGAKRDCGEDTDEMEVKDPNQDTAVSSISSGNYAVSLEIQNNIGLDSSDRPPSSFVNDFLEDGSEVFTDREMRLFSSGVPKILEREPTGSQQKDETERNRRDTEMMDLIEMTDIEVFTELEITLFTAEFTGSDQVDENADPLEAKGDLVVSKDLVGENEDPRADEVSNLEGSGNAICDEAFLYDKKPHNEEKHEYFPENSTETSNCEDDSAMVKECTNCDNEDMSCMDSDDTAAKQKIRLPNLMISSTVGRTEGRQDAIAVTPKKPMNILDLKENIVSCSKGQQQLGSVTATKSVAKRQPLKDLQQKLL